MGKSAQTDNTSAVPQTNFLRPTYERLKMK